MAIGIRFGDKCRGYGCSSARAVFHDDRLAQLNGELIQNHPRDDVDSATGRKRHDCAHWLHGPRL